MLLLQNEEECRNVVVAQKNIKFRVDLDMGIFLEENGGWERVGREMTYSLLRFMLRTGIRGSVLCTNRIFSVQKS